MNNPSDSTRKKKHGVFYSLIWGKRGPRVRTYITITIVMIVLFTILVIYEYVISVIWGKRVPPYLFIYLSIATMGVNPNQTGGGGGGGGHSLLYRFAANLESRASPKIRMSGMGGGGGWGGSDPFFVFDLIQFWVNFPDKSSFTHSTSLTSLTSKNKRVLISMNNHTTSKSWGTFDIMPPPPSTNTPNINVLYFVNNGMIFTQPGARVRKHISSNSITYRRRGKKVMCTLT